MAEGNLELVVTQLGSFAQVTLRGPVTQAQGEGTARLLGAILLGCTFLYAAPQTAALGAIMLTGYLGGAVAVKLRIGDPLLTHVLFGVYVGTLVWAGLYLRDARLRQILPLRSDVHDQTALPA